MMISVVVNTVNRAGHLGTLLAALGQQRYRDFEIVVVNGPSTDGTAAVLRAAGAGIKTVRCPDMNLSMSRNNGIAMAAGVVVAFIDDDAIPEPGWLDGIAAAFSDPRVGIVGGPLLDHTGTEWQVRHTVCDRLGRARHPRAPAAGAEAPGCPSYQSPTGANSAFRRAALAQVGGFDEAFSWFLDETDVTLRIVDAGWAYAHAADAVVHHKYAPSHLRTEKRLPRDLYQPVLSMAYFSFRHGLPALGARATVARVAREVSERMVDVWMLERSGMLPATTAAALREGIQSGARQGARLAMSRPPQTLPGRLDTPLAPFLPFHPRLRPGERLRVCLLSQDYPPGKVGGIGVWTETLARALADLGHEVTVVCRGAAHTVDFQDGVWVHRIVPRRMDPGIMRDVPRCLADYANTVAAEVDAVAAGRGVDVVSAPIWDLEGEAVRRAGRIPVVTSLHTTYRMSLPSKPEWSRHKDYFDAHVAPIMEAEDRIVREAPLLLGNSHAIVRDVFAGAGQAVDQGRVRHAPHGMRDIRPDHVAAPVARRQGGVQILYVGRLERRKGIDVLVEAADELLKAYPEARLTIVGNEEHDFERPWERVVSETSALRPHLARIDFEGFVTARRLQELYAGCDVFVAPSRYESFGLIFLEAMMHSKPCIGTTAGGIPEVIENGVTGLLARPGDAASLLDCLSRLAGDPALRANMGRLGRERYEREFSVGAMATAASGAYAEAIAAGAPDGRSRGDLGSAPGGPRGEP